MPKLKQLFINEWRKPKTPFDKLVDKLFNTVTILALVWFVMYFFVWK